MDKPLAKLALGLLFTFVLVVGSVVVFSDPEQDAPIKNLIFANLLTALIFSAVMFGSFAGLLALFASFIPKGMNADGAERWEATRKRGKIRFVRNAFGFSIPVIVIMTLMVLFPTEPPQIPFAEAVRNLIVFILVVIGLTVFVAIYLWNDNERQYGDFNTKSESEDHTTR